MGSRSSTFQLESGLPALYGELIDVLQNTFEGESEQDRQKFVTDTITASASRIHAQESFRLGYTVSQLVHGYGCLCQGITEYAHENREPITDVEFSQLNFCLDVAIAQAVSEFEALSLASAERSDTIRLGYLVHELRNYLTSAILAHELIRKGGVAAAGATSAVLTNSHQHMRELIDRAVAGIRMNGHPAVEHTQTNIFSLLSEVESSLQPEANAREVSLIVDADPTLDVNADRHLLASALANLIQNAVKFTAEGSNVWVRAFREGDRAVIDVEDRCGGLLEGKTEQLFAPFVQENTDKSGLGLGLSIARRAVHLNDGDISAQNLPGLGCVFTIRLPIYVADGMAAPLI